MPKWQILKDFREHTFQGLNCYKILSHLSKHSGIGMN